MDIETKIQSLQEMIEELNLDLLDDSIVKSNQLPFLYKEQLYRVKMPKQKDLTIAKSIEDKLKIQLLRDSNSITKKALIKVLKENQGIDILELNETKDKYTNRLKDLYMELATTSDKESKRINNLKNSINEVKSNHMQVSIEISDLLSPSIEHQVETAYIKYLTTVCTEKNIEDNQWELAWKDYETFENDDTNLPNLANLCFTRLFLTLRN